MIRLLQIKYEQANTAATMAAHSGKMPQLYALLDEKMYFNIVLRAGRSLSYLVYFRHPWGKRVERTDQYFFLQLHDEKIVLNFSETTPSLTPGC